MTALTRSEPGTFSVLTREERELAAGRAKFLDVLSALRELAWGAGVLLQSREELRAACGVGIHKLKEALAFWEAHGRIRRLGLRGSPRRGAIEVLPPPKSARAGRDQGALTGRPTRAQGAPVAGVYRGARRPVSAPGALFTLEEQREEETVPSYPEAQNPPREGDGTGRDGLLLNSGNPTPDLPTPEKKPPGKPDPERRRRAEAIVAHLREDHNCRLEEGDGERFVPRVDRPGQPASNPEPDDLREIDELRPEVRELVRREACLRLPPAERPATLRAAEAVRSLPRSTSPARVAEALELVFAALGEPRSATKDTLGLRLGDVADGVLSAPEVAAALVTAAGWRDPWQYFGGALKRMRIRASAAREKAAAGAT